MSNKKELPEEFVKIMNDFLKDILNTFPEYKDNLAESLKNIMLENPDKEKMKELFNFCNKNYPPRFFDILYQNDKIFEDDKINTIFLPEIDFKNIWIENISDKTREIIWKYLQLICFCVVGSQTEGQSFGETAKFFEAIDENEFKRKLEETIGQMTELFENDERVDGSNISMPDAEELHNHISGLLDGQLGCLAKEIAEETAEEMKIDLNNVGSVEDVFKQLFKNPGKLMKIVKKVGTKLDEKLKSGELKETELLKEATELMQKMGNAPGMKNINSLFSQMGLNPGKTKINQGALQSHLRQNMRMASMRERMQKKLAERNNQKPKKKREKKKEVIESSWLPETYTNEKTPRKKKKKRKKNKK